MRFALPLFVLVACSTDPEQDGPNIDDTPRDESGPFDLAHTCPGNVDSVVLGEPGEELHWLATGLPYDAQTLAGDIDTITYSVSKDIAQTIENATFTCGVERPHQVAIWVQDRGRPVEQPQDVILRDVSPTPVEEEVGWSVVQIDIRDEGLTIGPGEALFVAVHNNATWTENQDGTFTGETLCFQACENGGDHSWWSTAEEMPFDFTAFPSLGLPVDLFVVASGNR
ncbi:MAG: hypothetical protein EP330_15715 [Deltaproteobacteria bacterium]|nr:MAG: hypothetical protein EP330_15715 [Deltaproteobacteria bacterium]